jgi:hypothetical protein
MKRIGEISRCFSDSKRANDAANVGSSGRDAAVAYRLFSVFFFGLR